MEETACLEGKGGLFFYLTADLAIWYSKCTLLAVEMTGL